MPPVYVKINTLGGIMAINTFFDWSTLDRKSIINHIMLTKSVLVGDKLSVDRVHSTFSNNLKCLAPFKIKRIYNYKVDPGHVYIGGSYYSYLDREYDRCLEISLCYFDPETLITISSRKLKQIATLIADTVLHEIIHMRQYRRRQFKSVPDYVSKADKSDIRQEQAYLGSSDELDAYAFNIACEMYSKFNGNVSFITKYLDKPLKNHKYKHTWRIYLHAFEYNHNHPIIKRLKKKIINYLPMAEIGKPYKGKDWINW
jgi:hypothetical protein